MKLQIYSPLDQYSADPRQAGVRGYWILTGWGETIPHPAKQRVWEDTGSLLASSKAACQTTGW